MSPLTRICMWVEKLTGVIVLIPHPAVVGNCGEQIYHALLKARREGRKLAILSQYRLPWPLGIRLTNQELFAVESDLLAFSASSFWYRLGSLAVTAYVAIARLLNLFFRRLGHPLSDADIYPCIGHTTLWQPTETIAEFSWEVVAGYDWPAQLKSPLPIWLSSRKKEVAIRERDRLGLPRDAWFVCLHVREGGFHRDNMVERNADILNYVEAIKEVTGRGGWVVRMGDPTMTRLPAMDRVIDYPFSIARSPLMDIYLIRECRAYIGMPSGILEVATLFHRPTILTNMPSWLWPYPTKWGEVGVFKHVYSKSRQRYLSLREWMDEPFESVSFFALGSDYILVENDAEELRATVQEFFERNGDGEPTPLQRECSNLRLQRGRALVNKPMIIQDAFSDIHNRYRVASHLESAIGVISDAYLKQNWERDSRQEKP